MVDDDDTGRRRARRRPPGRSCDPSKGRVNGKERSGEKDDAGLCAGTARRRPRLPEGCAQQRCTLAEPGDIGNATISTIINCAIAYADVLTAKYRGEINRKDHHAAVRLLRETLGNDLPSKQESLLRALLEQKDEVKYGSRVKTRAEAERALEKIEEFAEWAEQMHAR